MDDDRSAYLDSVLIGGREPASIVVVDYDDAWPDRFEVLADRVRQALGRGVRRLEHIGSTSVPGLAAKPIIDMLLVVDDVQDEAAFVPALKGAGFELRVREPGHRMFRTPERDMHLHVYAVGRPETSDYLDLRDWLRVSSEDRTLYESVKRRLAQQQWADMNDYADAKTDVVLDILNRARLWRAGARPTVV
ncbi:GrpB family protein [Pengzhenrongella sicca]|uniref:GrpB family protein n=1 Tax=Pengzhenrongella sicca TaxID=2819238 RepID=A0A8A4ZHA9_9MICO|nr:GrpB family protein [Pengzhenrongella sicca]QTE30369.1 GrpB family protein [Pengzhenrongella sicca]